MKVNDSQLLAYVDGRLPPDICRGIESEIENSPHIARRVALLQASALPYSQAFAQQKLPEIPPHLVSRITDLGRAYRLGEIHIVTRNTRLFRGLCLAAAFAAGTMIGGLTVRFALDLAVPGVVGAILSPLTQDASSCALAAAGYQRLYSPERCTMFRRTIGYPEGPWKTFRRTGSRFADSSACAS